MSTATLEKTKKINLIDIPLDINFDDRETVADIAEFEDILVHPEKYKSYETAGDWGCYEIDKLFHSINIASPNEKNLQPFSAQFL